MPDVLMNEPWEPPTTRKIPWYVWPLRPILLWVTLIVLLALWPVYTLIGFCLIAYAIEAGERIYCWKTGRCWADDGIVSFLFAPLKLFVILLISSFGGIIM